MNLFFYHRVPENMKGDILYPLNQLKDIYPESYDQQVRKYNGREILLTKRVKTLDCLWNDVLHFSPINPVIIENELKNIGFEYKPAQYYKFHFSSFNRDNLCLYYQPIGGDEIETTDLSKLEELDLDQIPDATINYYQECYDKDIHPLLYYGLPHILYKGVVNCDNSNQ